MGVIATEANKGGGLHGRITVEMKKAFFDEVKGYLISRGYTTQAQNLEYHDLFNLSGGTSFGALSVAGMSKIKGKSRAAISTPHDLADFIDQEAGHIFPNYKLLKKIFNSPRQLTAGIFATTKFSNKPLKSLMHNLIGMDTKMGDVENDIMLTITRMYPDISAMFAKSHVARGETTLLDNGDEADRKNWILWQAALASASPTMFLPGVKLDNKYREQNVWGIDGGQSGFNNPSIPVNFETGFVYGKVQEEGKQPCVVYDFKKNHGIYIPHEVVHIHWGTGNHYKVPSEKQVEKNTLLSMKEHIVTASMEGVSRFSQEIGEGSIKNYFNFDIDLREMSADKLPDSDFTLSSPKQMVLLRDAGLKAAETLHDQIQEAAQLVADAYITRIEYEAQNPGMIYKEFLRSDVCPV